ncbi:hypothetical protein AG0111_0g12850 [Alternaria gaisen]|uniref:Uncharacterized protein n=1 Tax=Alternaria gaisen TaxID=167740 RepID=A0ACB6F3C7_9PLEO|nr:hypothetical protein AG0111_0g12850 [Alternaria gaisen]
MTSQVKIDSTAAGNHYMQKGLRTKQSCVRCLGAFGDGHLMYFGAHGCLMPDMADPAAADIFSAWKETSEKGEDIQYAKCLRCWILHQECVAVPDAEKKANKEITVLMNQFEAKERVTMTPNPHYNADSQGPAPDNPDEPAPTSGPVVNTWDTHVRDTYKFSEVELKTMEYQIRDKSSKLSKDLERKYKPFWDNLWLHSGAVSLSRSAEADIRPETKSRSGRAVRSKHKANEILDNRRVQEELSQTPKKRKTSEKARLELENDLAVLNAEVTALEEEQATARGPAKASVTKRLKLKNKEVDKLKAQLGGP